MAKKRASGEGSICFSETEQLWIGQITLPDGKRRRKRSKTQKVIKDWLLAQRDAIRDGLVIEDERITVGQFLDRYLQDVAAHTLRPKTFEAYSYLIRMHIKPALGNIRLNQLRPARVQKFYADKLESGLSRRTVQFMHSVLHKALQQALKWGMVVRNVGDLVEAPSPNRCTPITFSPDQVKKFLETVKEHRWYPIYVVALYCGLREGEVLGIHFEDLDLLHDEIHVRHAVQYLIGKGLVITEPKTDSAKRTVTIPGFAHDVLVEYLHPLKRDQGLIFVTSNDTPISPRNLVRHFKEALEEAGLPEIRFHDLRHTHASLLLAAGVHPKLVQERLGHSQISLTLDTYSHVTPNMQDGVAQKFDELMK
jgi:integrase